MSRMTLSFALVICLAGCAMSEEPFLAPPTAQTPTNAVSNPPSAPPSTSPSTSPSAPQLTSLPAEISDIYTQYQTRTYHVAAPSDGTLVGRLTWDPQKTGARLKLTIGDSSFEAPDPNTSVVIGRSYVRAGVTYRVDVEEGFAVWDYGANQDPFVLALSIEP
jgi:hypothetical protein